jgi:hypothetical protein
MRLRSRLTETRHTLLRAELVVTNFEDPHFTAAGAIFETLGLDYEVANAGGNQHTITTHNPLTVGVNRVLELTPSGAIAHFIGGTEILRAPQEDEPSVHVVSLCGTSTGNFMDKILNSLQIHRSKDPEHTEDCRVSENNHAVHFVGRQDAYGVNQQILYKAREHAAREARRFKIG